MMPPQDKWTKSNCLHVRAPPLNSVFLLQLRNPKEARTAIGLREMVYEGAAFHIALHRGAIPAKLNGRKGDKEWVSSFIRNLLFS